MEVRTWINKHKNTIRTQQTELPAHFVTNGHSVSQLKLKIIDGVPPLRRGGDRQRALIYLKYKIWNIKHMDCARMISSRFFLCVFVF